MEHWPLAFFEFAVVLAFGIGWLVLEWQCRRLDRKREAARSSSDAPDAPTDTAVPSFNSSS
ncbi:MAG: hypothetical protein ACRCS9_08240 [Hyphomicrobium sp.]